MIKKRRNLWFATIIALFIIIFFVRVELPHFGQVLDFDSGRPLRGVVAHIDLMSTFIVPAAELPNRWEGAIEGHTDEYGKYYLPVKLKGLNPIELSTGHTLSLYKAGYFPSDVHSPSLHNSVRLRPIQYYLDFEYFRKNPGAGSNAHYFIDRHLEHFALFKAELSKMTVLTFDRAGANGVLLEIPGGVFTKLLCTNGFRNDAKTIDGVTDWIGRDVCVVLDELSGEWFRFNSQGEIAKLSSVAAPSKEYLPFNLDLQDWSNTIYASKTAIFIPQPLYTTSQQNVAAIKGGISSLVGSSSSYLTIENDGHDLCYANQSQEHGCISINDIYSATKKGSVQSSSFVLLVSTSQGYFVITKMPENYQLRRIIHEPNQSSKSSQLYQVSSPLLVLPDKSEITDFDADGNQFFLAFASGELKKYSFDPYDRNIVKENTAFSSPTSDLFKGRIVSVKIGYSGLEQRLYLTTGDSHIYSLSIENGSPDCRIKVLDN